MFVTNAQLALSRVHYHFGGGRLERNAEERPSGRRRLTELFARRKFKFVGHAHQVHY
jgi:hypothetical protein